MRTVCWDDGCHDPCIHIALTTPSDGFGSLLGPDGTVSVDRTKPPVQLQDAMAALAS
jgi:hypothetical protein